MPLINLRPDLVDPIQLSQPDPRMELPKTNIYIVQLYK